jgi:predicted PurR-regulated permease PerM
LTVCTCILGILLIGCLALAWEVLLPLALAVLVAFILTPLVARLQRSGLGRVPSVILVSSGAMALVLGFGAVIVLQLRSLVIELPQYRDNIKQKVAAFQSAGPGSLMVKVQDAISELTEQPSGSAQAAPLPVEVRPSAPARVQALITPALSLSAQFALVSILVVFMLARHEDVRDRLIGLVGRGRLTDTTRALDEASRRVSRYLSMQLIINTCFGLALGLCLFLIGVPQAILWGLLVGALRFVPYLGSPLGGLMLVTLSVAVFPSWGQPLAVLGVFLVLEVLTANVMEPLLFGHSTGVAPIALLFAAAFWAWLWGPLGLLLSTPLTVCLVVFGRYVPGLECFGILLSDEPALPPEKRYYQRLLARDPDEPSTWSRSTSKRTRASPSTTRCSSPPW